MGAKVPHMEQSTQDRLDLKIEKHFEEEASDIIMQSICFHYIWTLSDLYKTFLQP